MDGPWLYSKSVFVHMAFLFSLSVDWARSTTCMSDSFNLSVTVELTFVDYIVFNNFTNSNFFLFFCFLRFPLTYHVLQYSVLSVFRFWVLFALFFFFGAAVTVRQLWSKGGKWRRVRRTMDRFQRKMSRPVLRREMLAVVKTMTLFLILSIFPRPNTCLSRLSKDGEYVTDT